MPSYYGTRTDSSSSASEKQLWGSEALRHCLGWPFEQRRKGHGPGPISREAIATNEKPIAQGA